jgi:chromosomal replication initiation ATPase DnaA
VNLNHQVPPSTQLGGGGAFGLLGVQVRFHAPINTDNPMAFREGSKIYLESDEPKHSVGTSNPYYPSITAEDGSPIFGKIVGSDSDGYRVAWDNGTHNSYTDAAEFKAASAWKAISDVKGIDLTHLDKLIISPSKRRAIVAVLKQHQHSKKIFEEWGLGEVIEYGRGMTMLFHGPPGCGKTWAAQCIAEAMGKKVLVMENAQLQSSTPGQMERNIQEAFKKATTYKQVLFFDECDSLLTSRDHVGMIIGSEINCLLTQIEKFEGVCILATNRIGELDAALERRISLIVKFPKPNLEQRKAIWKRFLPSKLPLAEDVDMEELVATEVSGGLIKNIVLNAARNAVAEDREAVSMDDFREAMKAAERGGRAFDTPSTSIATPIVGRGVGRDVTVERSVDVTREVTEV